jgi:hypothetical protein
LAKAVPRLLILRSVRKDKKSMRRAVFIGREKEAVREEEQY